MVLRIFKMIATSDFMTASECTKFVFGRPGRHWGSLQRSRRPPSWFKGPYFWERGKGEGHVKGSEREREGPAPSFTNSWILPSVVYHNTKTSKHRKDV